MTEPRTIVLQEKPATGRKRVQKTVTRTSCRQLRRPRCRSRRRPPAVDIEQFSQNIARMVEEGGKALAAYLKPREDGEVKIEPADEIADVVKTLGQVAEYWLSDPQRAVEVQTGLGKAYLELWAAASKRLAGETIAPVAAPDAARQALRRPRMVVEPVLRFHEAGLSAHHAVGRPAGEERATSTSTRATRPSSTSSRSATRSRRRTSC